MKEYRRSYRYCGRDFSGGQLEKIRQIIASDDRPNWATISRRVCVAFGVLVTFSPPQAEIRKDTMTRTNSSFFTFNLLVL